MLFIRVDMNDTIATGHMMRCLSIADAARSLGEETTFILADENGKDILDKKNYPSIILYSRWDDLDSEIPSMLNAVKQYHIQKLLIDTYQVTEAYLRALQGKAYTVYMDDLNAFQYPVTAVLCYAVYHDKFRYGEHYGSSICTKIYEGCRFAPLRKEFCALPSKEISERIGKVLVMSGGADPYHAIEEILETVQIFDYDEVNVLCGRYNNDYEMLLKKYISRNIHIMQASDQVMDLMREADLAISAGGTTLYELCACGTPTITYSLADNQLDNVTEFERRGIMRYAGDIRFSALQENMRVCLQEYADKEYRMRLSEKMQALVDGRGAYRIVEEVMRGA